MLVALTLAVKARFLISCSGKHHRLSVHSSAHDSHPTVGAQSHNVLWQASRLSVHASPHHSPHSVQACNCANFSTLSAHASISAYLCTLAVIQARILLKQYFCILAHTGAHQGPHPAQAKFPHAWLLMQASRPVCERWRSSWPPSVGLQ